MIRLAGERALQRGMRTQRCLECLAETRARLGPDVPLIPMTYASILEAYGYERFWADAQAAGATSLIVADLPLEAAPEIPRVQLVAPTSTSERIGLAAARTRRLALSRLADRHDRRADERLVAARRARRARAGRHGRAAARRLRHLDAGAGGGAAALADGIVVGSRAVQVADEAGAAGLRDYVASLRAALDELAVPRLLSGRRRGAGCPSNLGAPRPTTRFRAYCRKARVSVTQRVESVTGRPRAEKSPKGGACPERPRPSKARPSLP